MTGRAGKLRGGILLAAALFVAGAASPAAGQRLDLELRAGGAVGNYTATDAGLEFVPGPSFGALVEVGLTGPVSGYVGFTRSTFGCDEALCTGRDVTLTSQGLVLGARWTEGLFWGRAGLSLQALNVTSEVQDETSDPGIGWDLGVGAQIPLGRGVRLRPGLSYLRHDAPTDVDGHVAVLGLEIGVAVGLGL